MSIFIKIFSVNVCVYNVLLDKKKTICNINKNRYRCRHINIDIDITMDMYVSMDRWLMDVEQKLVSI